MRKQKSVTFFGNIIMGQAGFSHLQYLATPELSVSLKFSYSPSICV
jgi:hypothetical protein